MIQNIFSIYDEKAEAYNAPFFKATIGQALRDFVDISTNPETTLNRHPSDFSLYHIGEFDDHSSSITSFNEPKFLSRANEHVNKPVTITEGQE